MMAWMAPAFLFKGYSSYAVPVMGAFLMTLPVCLLLVLLLWSIGFVLYWKPLRVRWFRNCLRALIMAASALLILLFTSPAASAPMIFPWPRFPIHPWVFFSIVLLLLFAIANWPAKKAADTA